MPVDSPSADQIAQAMIADRFELSKLKRAIDRARKAGQPHHHLLKRWQKRITISRDQVSARTSALPNVAYAADLPIVEHREKIIASLRQHQVLVISGETGSGKSTQLPKICLEAGFGVYGLIGHTQPRRIAARSVASRVAEELKCPQGQEVGFKIRFVDKTNPRTYIKLMTDGILLAETQHDRFLEQYEVIILDEAHERSLNIDFLLGYIRRLLPKRPELRLIVTSATIDAERFAEHFPRASQPAPIIKVSGRTYPVDVLYRPFTAAEGNDVEGGGEPDVHRGIIEAVHELAEMGRGHMLVFLPTERDIREVAKRLRAEKFAGGSKTEVLPLYARLSATDQNRVFQPTNHRRIVLATNVAESSLTVPGIHYVIDTGTARISRYAPRSKVQRLPIEPVSRASANQRTGRCGRIAAGTCIRLFSETDYQRRPKFTTPEIQRTNLAAVILQAKSLKLGSVEQFPFIDPPRPESIRDGYRTLFEIGAVDAGYELTDLGRRLSRLPVDPRIGRIVLAADVEGCLADMLIIAAALELQDPRERPHGKHQAADEAQAKFTDEDSDFMSFLKLWDFYHEQKENLTRGKLRKACQQNFLSFNRMREWTEIHRQLKQLTSSSGLKPRQRTGDYDAIHRALLTGFLSGVAYRSSEFEYTGAGGIKFHLWPGSGLFAEKPKWCVCSELIETSRRYGRTVARINPNWIEPLAAHVLKRSYRDPHWHNKSASVMAFEQVTLFGVPIVARRRIRYGPIDPQASRRIFLRDGLAGHELDVTDKFFVHNQRVLKDVAKMAAKTRSSQYLVDEYTIADFYDQRLPDEICDLDQVRKWLRDERKNNPQSNAYQSLLMTVEDLLPEEGANVEQYTNDRHFPNEMEINSMQLPLDYQFAPGEDHDGISITVPEEALPQVRPGHVGWLVPGLLEEKITAMIRSLPKAIRRGLIPAPDTARRVAEELEFGEGDFLEQVAARLGKVAGEKIPSDAFRLEKIPSHLQANIRVVDDQGQVKTQGRDIVELRAELGLDDTPRAVEVVDSDWHRDNITKWDFGELPESITLARGGIQMAAFPVVVDNGEDVGLRLLGCPQQAARTCRAGIRRLYVLAQRKALRSQVNWLPRFEEVCLLAAPIIKPDQLKRQTLELLADLAFLENEEQLPRTAEEFASRLTKPAERIGIAAQDVAKFLPQMFDAYQSVRLAIETTSTAFTPAIIDVKTQITNLAGPDFLIGTPWRWLKEFPRYFTAMAHRLDRVRTAAGLKDREHTAEMDRYWQSYTTRRAAHTEQGLYDRELETYRWMLEEYRVSLFAQSLGTSVKVSPTRLEKQWDKVRV